MQKINFSDPAWLEIEYPAAYAAGLKREPRRMSGDVWEQVAYSIGWHRGQEDSPVGLQPPRYPLTVVESKGAREA